MSSMFKKMSAEQRLIARENRKKIKAYEKELHRTNYTRSEFVARMKNDDNVLEVDNLHTHFISEEGTVRAIEGVSFDVPQGKIVGIIGEKGSGKSVTSLSIMQLLDRPEGIIVEGQIRLKLQDDQVVDIASMPLQELDVVRGSAVAMVTDEPTSDLHPVFMIGDQLDEVIGLHYPEMSYEEVKDRSLEILKLVKIGNPEDVYGMYPSQLSAGMRQRVSIAIALACEPSVIILDEPTRSLDVTIRAQIIDLLQELNQTVSSSMILITNDLGDVSVLCDYVIVMEQGRVVERGTTTEVFETPAHPYTQALLDPLTQVRQNSDRLFSTYKLDSMGIKQKDSFVNIHRENEATEDDFVMESLSDTHYVARFHTDS